MQIRVGIVNKQTKLICVCLYVSKSFSKHRRPADAVVNFQMEIAWIEAIIYSANNFKLLLLEVDGFNGVHMRHMYL